MIHYNITKILTVKKIIFLLFLLFISYATTSILFLGTLSFEPLKFNVLKAVISQSEFDVNTKNLKIKDNELKALTNDPQIIFNLTDKKHVQNIAIEVSELSIYESEAQLFLKNSSEGFSEENSIKFILKNGMNYLKIPENYYFSLRLDPTNMTNVTLKIDRIIFSNGFVVSLEFWLVLIGIFLLSLSLLFAYKALYKKREFINQSIFKVLKQHPKCVLFALVLISTFLVYRKFIFQGQIFMYGDIGSDTKNGYFPIYNLIVDKIRNNNFSFWSFAIGTGANILTFQATICDPFAVPILLSGIIFGKESMLYLLIYMHITKIFLCAFLCYSFLGNFKISQWIRLFISFIFSFNGFLILWGQHYFLGTACVYILTILNFIEKGFFSRKALIGLTIVTFSLMSWSFYIAYIILLISAIFAIIRIIQKQTMFSLKKTVLQLLPIGISVTIGMLMGMVVFIPSALVAAGESSRFEGNSSVINRILTTLFSSYSLEEVKSYGMRFLSNNLSGTGINYSGIDNYYEAPQWFFSSFSIILIFQYISNIFKKCKNQRTIEIIVGFVSVSLIFFPIGSFILNGFVAPFGRYTFALMPLLAYIYADALQKIWTEKTFNISFLIISLLVTGVVLGSSNQPDYSLFLLVIIIIGTICLYLMSNSYNKKFVLIFLAMVFVNTISDSYITTNFDRVLVKNKFPSIAEENYSQDTNKALQYINSENEVFYRVDKTYSDLSSQNDAVLQGYNSISAYNSLMDADIQNFTRYIWPSLEVKWSRHDFTKTYDDVKRASLLGVNFILSTKSLEDIPDYTLIQQFGEVKAYKNTQSGGLGIFFDKTISEEKYLQLNEAQRENAIGHCLITENGGPHEISQDNFLSSKSFNYQENAPIFKKPVRDDLLEGTIETNSNGVIFLSIPYQKGWTAKVDERIVPIQKANFGYSMIPITQGIHKLKLSYSTPGLKLGALMSAFGFLSFIFFFLWLYGKNKYCMSSHKRN